MAVVSVGPEWEESAGSNSLSHHCRQMGKVDSARGKRERERRGKRTTTECSFLGRASGVGCLQAVVQQQPAHSENEWERWRQEDRQLGSKFGSAQREPALHDPVLSAIGEEEGSLAACSLAEWQTLSNNNIIRRASVNQKKSAYEFLPSNASQGKWGKKEEDTCLRVEGRQEKSPLFRRNVRDDEKKMARGEQGGRS